MRPHHSHVDFSVSILAQAFTIFMVKRARRDCCQEKRDEKQIIISIDTLLRVKFGLPVDRSLSEPQPCTKVEVLAYLWARAQQTATLPLTQVMSPTPNSL